MQILELRRVESCGTQKVVTLHGEVEMAVYPKTEVTALIDAMLRYTTARNLGYLLGIEGVRVHSLREGNFTCDLAPLKEILKSKGLLT